MRMMNSTMSQRYRARSAGRCGKRFQPNQSHKGFVNILKSQESIAEEIKPGIYIIKNYDRGKSS